MNLQIAIENYMTSDFHKESYFWLRNYVIEKKISLNPIDHLNSGQKRG